VRRIGTAILAALALALALGGCGASADQNAISATVAAYYRALVTHDVAGACARVTAAYWAGFEQELAAQSGDSVTFHGGCTGDLTRLFSRAPAATSRAAPKFALTEVSVSGNTATATLGGPGKPGQLSRFIRAPGGGWRIDCCAGSQLDQQPRVPYRVPSGSMLPTLHIGQTVISDNAAMRAHPPALGQIIVFHPPLGADPANPKCGDARQGFGHAQACDRPTPTASAQTFIKRVVGLPGDRIAIVDGHVIRNGAREQDSYTTPCGASPDCNFPKPIVIPPGEYFVLGDNRGESDDSRFWGPVKRAWIIGVVLR
jgi:signal peptidase I